MKRISYLLNYLFLVVYLVLNVVNIFVFKVNYSYFSFWFILLYLILNILNLALKKNIRFNFILPIVFFIDVLSINFSKVLLSFILAIISGFISIYNFIIYKDETYQNNKIIKLCGYLISLVLLIVDLFLINNWKNILLVENRNIVDYGITILGVGIALVAVLGVRGLFLKDKINKLGYLSLPLLIALIFISINVWQYTYDVTKDFFYDCSLFTIALSLVLGLEMSDNNEDSCSSSSYYYFNYLLTAILLGLMITSSILLNSLLAYINCGLLLLYFIIIAVFNFTKKKYDVSFMLYLIALISILISAYTYDIFMLILGAFGFVLALYNSSIFASYNKIKIKALSSVLYMALAVSSIVSLIISAIDLKNTIILGEYINYAKFPWCINLGEIIVLAIIIALSIVIAVLKLFIKSKNLTVLAVLIYSMCLLLLMVCEFYKSMPSVEFKYLQSIYGLNSINIILLILCLSYDFKSIKE